MSILIKGMEMPKRTYAHCMLIKDIDGSVKLHVCTEHSEYSSEWEQYDIDPVPMPHGRLIDADVLDKAFMRLDDYHADDSKSSPFIRAGISQCRDILRGRNTPTIIPAEEETV